MRSHCRTDKSISRVHYFIWGIIIVFWIKFMEKDKGSEDQTCLNGFISEILIEILLRSQS